PRPVLLQNLEHLRRPLQCRAVVDGERDDPFGRFGAKRYRRHVRPRAYWPGGPRRRSLGRESRLGREPRTGSSHATGGDQAYSGEELAAIHGLSLTRPTA